MKAPWICSLTLLFVGATTSHGAEAAAAKSAAGGSGWGWIGAVVVIAAVCFLAAAGWLARWFWLRRKQAARNDPRLLLRELCRAHSLSRRAEGLLMRAAATVGTPHPARFFLEPRLLRQAARCESLARSKHTLRLLYEELFGELDEE